MRGKSVAALFPEHDDVEGTRALLDSSLTDREVDRKVAHLAGG